MKTFFNQTSKTPSNINISLSFPTLKEDIEKTRIALENAYTGFDNAVDPDLIDCYIYEINALLKRYKYLSELYTIENSISDTKLYQHSSIGTFFTHIFRKRIPTIG